MSGSSKDAVIFEARVVLERNDVTMQALHDCKVDSRKVH